jgi:hypothetical protein
LPGLEAPAGAARAGECVVQAGLARLAQPAENTRRVSAARAKPRLAVSCAWLFGSVLLWLAAAGCTHLAAKQRKVEAQLAEESRVLTTAVVDTLNAQPSTNRDAYTATALSLATQDQRLEGLPQEPLEVKPIIAEAQARLEDGGAIDPMTTPRTVEQRFAKQNQALAEARRLSAALEERGRVAEQQRNQRLRRWTRWLSFGGLGLGGLAALLVFVPAAIPVLGRLLGWLVSRLPALAGAAGVVGVKAFDAVVRGVERFKQARAAAPAPTAPNAPPGAEVQELLDCLRREMNSRQKALVRRRRPTPPPAD